MCREHCTFKSFNWKRPYKSGVKKKKIRVAPRLCVASIYEGTASLS